MVRVDRRRRDAGLVAERPRAVLLRGQALMSVAVDAVGEALRADPPVQLFTGPDNHEDGRAIVSLTLVITYSSTVPRRSAFELIARRAGTLWQRRPAALT